MEMTFPHSTLGQDSVKGRHGHRAILAVVIARQANSQTVRAVRRAELDAPLKGGYSDNRIHYFAGHALQKMAVRGAFWCYENVQDNTKPDIYQAGLAYVKDHGLDSQATGVQLTLAGQGILRKL